MSATPAPWRMATDAQGPCMVMHPTRKGVAIASLTNIFRPVNGFHEDWECWLENGRLDEAATDARIAERNANARLIAASPVMLAALRVALPHVPFQSDEHFAVLAAIALAEGGE